MHLTDGVRDLSSIPPGQASGYEIRRADSTDAALIEPLERALSEHLIAPPIFLHPHGDWEPRFNAAWLEDKCNGLWLASHDGVAVGFISGHPANPGAEPVSLRSSDLLSINGAFRTLEGRRSGLATSLLAHLLTWAADNGYRGCAVDYESANIQGAGFWLSSGFTPVLSTLIRRVDSRFSPSR